MSFNKYIGFMDYGNAINALTEYTILDSEGAFYFYEECCDKGYLVECKTVTEVEFTCVKLFLALSEEDQRRNVCE